LRRALPIVLAASLTLGAAPSPSANEALECSLPYAEAAAALDRLPVQKREDLPGEDGYRHVRRFDPAHLTAFGFPVLGAGALKVDAISYEELIISTGIKGPYAAVRAAALASRGKTECTNSDTDGPAKTCDFGEREQDGWTINFKLTDVYGTMLNCVYSRTST
jgi:hypothetical protein